MATGKITKIDPLKQSSHKNQYYQRVYFQMFNSDGTTSWNKTDLVPTFVNFSRWKNLLKVGNVLSNLGFRSDMSINADSRPVLIKSEAPVEEKEIKTLKLL